jgi:hypothetical protein
LLPLKARRLRPAGLLPQYKWQSAMNQLAEMLVTLSTDIGNAIGRLGQYVDTGYDFGQDNEMANSSPTARSSSASVICPQDRCMLWIDGVGAYLLCLGERTTFGGPQRDGKPADVTLLANLSGRHASIVRDREGYLLEPHAPTRVAGRSVDLRASLNDGYEIELGGVRLRFRLPTVLSMTAAIDFVSDHRPPQSVDGVILMDETCLLGAGAENHIRCAGWNEGVLLLRRGGELCCKARGEILVDGRASIGTTPLRSGETVTGEDFRFRIEALN